MADAAVEEETADRPLTGEAFALTEAELVRPDGAPAVEPFVVFAPAAVLPGEVPLIFFVASFTS